MCGNPALCPLDQISTLHESQEASNCCNIGKVVQQMGNVQVRTLELMYVEFMILSQVQTLAHHQGLKIV